MRNTTNDTLQVNLYNPASERLIVCYIDSYTVPYYIIAFGLTSISTNITTQKKVYQTERVSSGKLKRLVDIWQSTNPRKNKNNKYIKLAVQRISISLKLWQIASFAPLREPATPWSISLPSPFGEGYGGEASYIMTMPQSSLSFAALSFLVELVGFEPTSKQGNHTLSTRLFQPLVFVRRQDLDHQPAP